ncbi:ATP-binding protein [Rhizobium sp. BK376]|uniref:ATP-binding protein n=1 Tax=Rhizobium sp. BK376 TaxID=2512149 RepID=UPI001053F06C|nr:ATP-binding protein [Rhizobium sp. BK376]TCR85287.1 signal transduction histidine kinase [Rhizobium sp. BK376]
MRPLEIFRTTSFRLALAFLLLFGAAAALLFVFVDWQMHDFLDRRSDEWLQREMQSIQRLPVAEITTRLTLRAKDGPSSERPFSLFDDKRQLIAGNAVAFPLEPEFEIPFDFANRASARTEHYRGLLHRLPDGGALLIAQSLQEQREFREMLENATLFASLATALLGLFGAGGIGLASMKRLDAISDAATRIMKGDLKQRLPTGRAGGDIDRLATVVNHMLDEIERLMHEVKGVCDSIAHDMRTPLTRLLASLERARRRATSVEDYSQAVEESLEEVQGILKTFSALLRISEVEDGLRRSGFVELDLKTIVRDAVEFFEPAAEERGVALNLLDGGPKPATALGDPSLIFEAIANLIDNAIKFTSEGGSATVRIENGQKDIVVSVEDTGIGIRPEDAEAVLRRFYRAERSRHAPGNGLGLSLVSAIARLHDTKLEIGTPATGTNVRLTFASTG